MQTHNLQELQLDGLAGPTHHFGGLSFGNLASMTHAGWHSQPRQAALQGLAKMQHVLTLGIPQAILPPLLRPDLSFLRRLGFVGSDTAILATVAAHEPYLLSLATSSAFMWAANAATVIPSCDSLDGRCHVVVANLAATPHRVLEGPERAAMFQRLFPDRSLVAIHAPLPPGPALSDEGAANHCRLAPTGTTPGLHMFVYGRAHDTTPTTLPRRFPARQRREASQAVIRLGHLPQERVLLVQQQARAIDAGAFHNDVVLVNAGERLLLHEYALVEQERILSSLRQSLPTLRIFQVAQRDLSLRQAVKSYLFNSQLLHSSQGYVLLAPLQSSQGPAARIIRRLVEEGFVDHVVFQDLEQSMAGGGGPACLRLRLPLTAQEMASIPPGILLNTTTLQRLQAWVTRYYRDALHPADLADPQLLQEAYEALDALTQLLALGAFYPFQRGASSASKGNI